MLRAFQLYGLEINPPVQEGSSWLVLYKHLIIIKTDEQTVPYLLKFEVRPSLHSVSPRYPIYIHKSKI